MNIKDYILEKYKKLKDEDFYTDKDGLFEYLAEDGLIFTIYSNNQEKSFDNAAECYDYITAKKIPNHSIKIAYSPSYYAKLIEVDFFINISTFSDKQITNMINIYYNEMKDHKFDNPDDILEQTIDLIEDSDDVVFDFFDNHEFAHVIVVHYILDIITEQNKKMALQSQIDKTISLEYANYTNHISEKLLKLLHNNPSDTNLIADLILNSQELNDNAEYQYNYLAFVDKKQIAAFFKSDELTAKKIIELYADSRIKALENSTTVLTITQIARSLIEDYINKSGSKVNQELKIEHLGNYLKSKSILRNAHHRDLFIKFSNLEQTAKKVAICLMIMDYHANTLPSINKEFIEKSNIEQCVKSFYTNDEFRRTIIAKYLHAEDHLEHAEEHIDAKFRTLAKIDSIY